MNDTEIPEEDRAVITRIPIETFNKLKHVAKKEGRSVAGQLRLMISHYIDQLEPKNHD